MLFDNCTKKVLTLSNLISLHIENTSLGHVSEGKVTVDVLMVELHPTAVFCALQHSGSVVAHIILCLLRDRRLWPRPITQDQSEIYKSKLMWPPCSDPACVPENGLALTKIEHMCVIWASGVQRTHKAEQLHFLFFFFVFLYSEHFRVCTESC